MNYDFAQLSPHDLELLARDLLQAEWGVKLESFKSGRDGGIDLRYARGDANVVVQCKHYVKSGFGALRRAMREEAAKVRGLAPERYVIVTSVALSPGNKDDIVGDMGAPFLAAADVMGAEDLNNLLGAHPDVESRHFKLWLASRAVLDRVVHNASVTQSELKVREVYADARRYVQSAAYPAAMGLLEEHGVVIVAGPPGVGKTTLANLLLYEHVERGYQAIVLAGDVKEGLDRFQPGEKQVFHFDDFLGATFLGDGAAVFQQKQGPGAGRVLQGRPVRCGRPVDRHDARAHLRAGEGAVGEAARGQSRRVPRRAADAELLDGAEGGDPLQPSLLQRPADRVPGPGF